MLKIRRTLAQALPKILEKHDGRFAMTGAHIIPPTSSSGAGILEATNGRILLTVPLEQVDQDEIPYTIPEELRSRSPLEGILSRETIDHLKGTGSKTRDPYSFFAMDPTPATGASAGTVHMFASNGQKTHLPFHSRGSLPLVDGEFPQTKHVIPQHDKVLVSLSIEYLENLLAGLKGAGADHVDVLVSPDKPATAPVCLKGYEAAGPRIGDRREYRALGVIMPMSPAK